MGKVVGFIKSGAVSTGKRGCDGIEEREREREIFEIGFFCVPDEKFQKTSNRTTDFPNF